MALINAFINHLMFDPYLRNFRSTSTISKKTIKVKVG